MKKRSTDAHARNFLNALTAEQKSVLGEANTNWFEVLRQRHIAQKDSIRSSSGHISVREDHRAKEVLLSPAAQGNGSFTPAQAIVQPGTSSTTKDIGYGNELQTNHWKTPSQRYKHLVSIPRTEKQQGDGDLLFETSPVLTSPLLSTATENSLAHLKTPGNILFTPPVLKAPESRGKRIAAALGVDPNTSNVSWTSEFITPKKSDLSVGKENAVNASLKEEAPLGAVRVLFTSVESGLHSSQEYCALNTTTEAEDSIDQSHLPADTHVTRLKKACTVRGRLRSVSVLKPDCIHPCKKRDICCDDLHTTNEEQSTRVPSVETTDCVNIDRADTSIRNAQSVFSHYSDTTIVNCINVANGSSVKERTSQDTPKSIRQLVNTGETTASDFPREEDEDALSLFISPPSRTSTVRRRPVPKRGKRKTDSDDDLMLSPLSRVSPIAKRVKLSASPSATKMPALDEKIACDEKGAVSENQRSLHSSNPPAIPTDLRNISNTREFDTQFLKSDDSLLNDNGEAELSSFCKRGNETSRHSTPKSDKSECQIHTSPIGTQRQLDFAAHTSKDLEFTQISPTALSAMCDAAQETMSNPDSNVSNELNLGLKSDVPERPELQTKESQDINRSQNTPVKWKESYKTPNIFRNSGVKQITDVSENVNVSVNNASVCLLPMTRKAKRFSYPTSRQIQETCPRKVFNFAALEKSETTASNSSKGSASDVDRTININIESDPVRGPSASVYGAVVETAKPSAAFTTAAPIKTEFKQKPDNKFVSKTLGNVTPSNYKPAEATHSEKRQNYGNQKGNAGKVKELDISVRAKTYNTNSLSHSTKNISFEQKKQNLPATTDSGFSFNVKDNAHNSEIPRPEKLPTDNNRMSACAPTLVIEAKFGSSATGGFSTASGKTIGVSDTARQKALNLMTEITNEHLDLKENAVSGFSTASGKSIAVSEAARQRAFSLISEITEEGLESKDDLSLNKTGQTSSSNQTLKNVMENKCVNMADFDQCAKKDKTWELKAKDTLWATLSSLEITNVKCGFSTASGKGIDISEVANRKANNILAEIETERLSGEPNIGTPSATKGMKMDQQHVSSDNITSLLEIDKLSKLEHHKMTSCSGFSSASGKLVQLSEEGLKKARNIVAEVSKEITTEQKESRYITNVIKSAIKDTTISLTESVMDTKVTGKENAFIEDLERILSKSKGSERTVVKDYSKLPQGFRPFKPPRPVTRTKPSPEPKPRPVLVKSREKHKMVKNHESKGDVENERSCADLERTDAELTYTQIAEISEGTAAFLDISDTQFPFTQAVRPKADITRLESQQLEVNATSSSDNKDYEEERRAANEHFQAGTKENKSGKSATKDKAEDKPRVKFGKLETKLQANQKTEEATCKEIIECTTPTKDKTSRKHIEMTLAKALFCEFDEEHVTKVPLVAQNMDSECSDKGAPKLYNTGLKLDINNGNVAAGRQTDMHNCDLMQQDRKSCCNLTSTTEVAAARDGSDVVDHLANQELQIPQTHIEDELQSPPIQVQSQYSSSTGIPAFVGFHTASGKRVDVTEESIKSARTLLYNETVNVFDESSPLKVPQLEDRTIRPDCENKTNSALTSTTSQTGCDSQATVSCTELAGDIRQRFKHDTMLNNTSHVNDDNIKAGKFEGFKTARGRKVTVSKDALMSAKSLLRDEIETVLDSSNDFVVPVTPEKNNVPMNHSALNKINHVVSINENTFIDISTKDEQLDKQSDKSLLVNPKHLLISEPLISNAKMVLESVLQTSDNNTKSFKDEKEVIEPHSNVPDGKFTGFQTASGNKVTISASALTEAKRLLGSESGMPEDTNTSVHTIPASDDGPLCVGFQTASGNKVPISERALKEAQRLSSSRLQSSSSVIDIGNNHEPMNAKPTQQTVGFQTASGNRVAISDRALINARKLLGDDVPFKCDTSKSKCENECKDKRHGSQTVNAENMVRSNDKRQKATATDNPLFSGFQTASGNEVNVSEDALKRTKSFFQGDNMLESETEDLKLKVGSPNIGFQTASGNKVEVSNKALKRAKILLQEDNELMCETESLPQKTAPPFIGFQTASGNKVNVSEGAVKRAKSLFEDDNALQSETHVLKQKATSPGIGFQTASGNKVNVSEEALKRAKIVLQDDKELTSVAECLLKKDISPIRGFQTDNGNKVHVSVEALKRAKSIFQDDGGVDTETEEKAIKNDSREPVCLAKTGFPGFQTVKGSAITVSTDALSTAKALLHGDMESTCGLGATNRNNVTLPTDTVKQESGFSGFQTAKGRTITVSTDALNKAKSILRGDHERTTMNSEVAAKTHQHIRDDDDNRVTRGLPVQDPTSVTVKSRKLSALLSSPEGVHGNRGSSIKYSEMKAMVTMPTENAQLGLESDTMRCRGRRFAYPVASKSETPQVPLATQQLNPKNTFQTPVKAGRTNIEPSDSKSASKSSSFATPYKKEVTSSFKTPVKTATKHQVEERKQEVDTDDKSSKDDDEILDQCIREIKTSAVFERASEDVIKRRSQARQAQAQAIRKKREANCARPSAGRLLQQKQPRDTAGYGVGLLEYTRGDPPSSYNKEQLYAFGVRHGTAEVCSRRAGDFRFLLADFYISAVAANVEGISVGDQGFLVMDEYGTVGKEEFSSALLAMPGVEPRLISQQWVYNHYRWVVWKLAAYEVALPQHFAARALTPENVMLQLKYRYDREIDNSHRSALKRIYERDDSAAKCLVLCLADIRTQPDIEPAKGPNTRPNSDTQTIQVELTDGWYPIRAALDPVLSSLVLSGRLRVGDKIVTYGAELIGSQDGCSPLEVAESLQLKLCANSTRRARWHSKLGFCVSPRPPPLPLSSLHPRGGQCSCVAAVVTRVYPMQYLEKTAGGSSVMRSERAEERAARAHERDRQRHLETAVAALEREFEMKQRHTDETSEGDLREEFALRMREVTSESATQRQVTPLLKVRLAGCVRADIDAQTSTIFSIWRPTGDIHEILQEGQALRIYNTAVSEARGKSQGTVRCGAVSLTAQRNTNYERLDLDENLLDMVHTPREVVSVSELHSGLYAPYGEVDVVGLVAHTSAPHSFHRASGEEGSVQCVYMSDASGSLVAVKFWPSLQAHCLEDVMTEGAFVACGNLQWHYDHKARIQSLIVGDMSKVVTNPREQHLKTELERLRQSLTNSADLVKLLKRRILGEIPAQTMSNCDPNLTENYAETGQCDSVAIATRPVARTTVRGLQDEKQIVKLCSSSGDIKSTAVQKADLCDDEEVTDTQLLALHEEHITWPEGADRNCNDGPPRCVESSSLDSRESTSLVLKNSVNKRSSFRKDTFAKSILVPNERRKDIGPTRTDSVPAPDHETTNEDQLKSIQKAKAAKLDSFIQNQMYQSSPCNASVTRFNTAPLQSPSIGRPIQTVIKTPGTTGRVSRVGLSRRRCSLSVIKKEGGRDIEVRDNKTSEGSKAGDRFDPVTLENNVKNNKNAHVAVAFQAGVISSFDKMAENETQRQCLTVSNKPLDDHFSQTELHPNDQSQEENIGSSQCATSDNKRNRRSLKRSKGASKPPKLRFDSRDLSASQIGKIMDNISGSVRSDKDVKAAHPKKRGRKRKVTENSSQVEGNVNSLISKNDKGIGTDSTCESQSRESECSTNQHLDTDSLVSLPESDNQSQTAANGDSTVEDDGSHRRSK